jgi:regulatory protein
VAPRRRETFAERRERRAAVDDPAVVLEAAMRFLEARSRSVAEVRRRLSTAGYRAELIDGAITRLGDLGMLDDEAFARAWVESRDRARPRGERALRDELRLKGVDRSLIDVVLAERRDAPTSGDGLANDDPATAEPDRLAADRLIRRHARALGRIDDPRKRRERAYALLARNGFDPETCRDVAAKVGETDPFAEPSSDPQMA